MSEIKVDVNKIMEEIRADIKAKGYTDETNAWGEVVRENDPHWRHYDEKVLKEKLFLSNCRASVPAYHEIRGGAKGAFKKAVRKAISFDIVPIVQDQNAFNENITHVVNMLSAYIDDNEKEKAAMKAEIEALKKEIAALKG
ncbi:MAG: hypothetical protein IJL97_01975 [Lachnospiraceae bacterium]|nr:hypothetical protein [Lachnospiraceae bacterium]